MLAQPDSSTSEVIPDGTSSGERLTVADLVRMFEESEGSTQNAREQSERDRDYLDNKQYTAEELAEFEKRGQPPTIDNRIKTKIDYLVGVEKQSRIRPKAMPRTPKHEQDADGASQGIKYVTDEEDYDKKRSAVWRNMLVEGAGGFSVSVEPSKYSAPQSPQQMMGSTAMTPPQEYAIKIRKIAWDRMFWDPHSSELDFSDAGYLGGVLWMDEADALVQYRDNPDAADIIANTMGSVTASQTYDDKPIYSVWADRKRKRIRIVQMWIKRAGEWFFAEYTKGGILKSGKSPYVTDKGESDCELIYQSAYVDRDNNRYGMVREMISLQDEINKRRSKSLHLLNVSQTLYEEGAIENIDEFRRQSVKPDGTMKVNPGALANKTVQFNTRTDLADGHFKLLEEAKNAIDLKGPNATEMGDKTGGSNAASGKAIIASQQGGMIQVGDLMDNLRHLDKRVFRAIWNRIRQFWTAEKWIRVTDDERNVKWVGLNVDPQRVEMLKQQNPQEAERIAGIVGNVAELDCDIIIDEAPDSLTPALEQFQALVELKKFDAGNEIPFRVLIEAAPNLRNKDKILGDMDKRAEQQAQDPMAQQAKQLQMRGAAAEVQKTESEAAKNMAQARQAGMPEQEPQQQQDFELPPEVQIRQALADIAKTEAEIEKMQASAVQAKAAAFKLMTDARLAPQKASQDAHDRQQDRQLAARKPVAA